MRNVMIMKIDKMIMVVIVIFVMVVIMKKIVLR